MARGGFFAGFLIGAVIGAGATFLFGTKPGEQVREQLLENRGDLGRRAQEAAALARSAADTLIDVSRDVIEEQRNRFQEAVRESREAAEETAAEMLAEYEKARHGEGAES